MKKNTLLLFLFVCVLGFAQGRRNGQSAIHAQYGFIPSTSDSKETSFMLNAGYLKVFNEQGWLGKAEAIYGKYDVSYSNNQRLAYERYGVNVQAGWTYEGLKPVYLNAFAGLFAGYEKVNNGKENDPLYNAKIPEKVKGFTYGLSGTAEVEVAIIPTKFSLIANYTQFYDLQSKFSKGSYGIFGGFRFYVN
ncbi:hypothetical protein J2O02_18335 (plasmid) [Elizabethkingia anophelis]|uniref:hypothetical protein n=1 Tax=Elizabethkingia anophelis TaxID=1117645 RepID=UPI0020B733DD|nr:hypothetical protein [Elizabethkingia anophelis]UTG66782.1 hypothetical protein J2O02_18335 [Elizabethkingia anophelis]